jgi:predicted dehydrogenase
MLHSSKLVADHGLRFAVHGTCGSWIKHGLDPQEAATVAGRLPGGDDWGDDPVEGLLTLGEAGATAARVPNRRGDYRLFWSALAEAIRGTAPNPVQPQEALAVMQVLDAGSRSAESGCEILL